MNKKISAVYLSARRYFDESCAMVTSDPALAGFGPPVDHEIQDLIFFFLFLICS